MSKHRRLKWDRRRFLFAQKFQKDQQAALEWLRRFRKPALVAGEYIVSLVKAKP